MWTNILLWTTCFCLTGHSACLLICMSPHELVFDIFFVLFCYGLRVLAKFKVTDYIFVVVIWCIHFAIRVPNVWLLKKKGSITVCILLNSPVFLGITVKQLITSLHGCVAVWLLPVRVRLWLFGDGLTPTRQLDRWLIATIWNLRIPSHKEGTIWFINGPHLHRDGRQDDLYVMKLQQQIVRESITRNCKEFYFKFQEAIMELCCRAAAYER